jgi:hypothetical protein
MKREFAEALKLGTDSEQLVAKMLPGYVVHTAQATRNGIGGGRIYQRDESQIAIPDLQHFHDGKAVVWFEVKWKERSVLFERTGQWRHGIDYKCLVAYENVAYKTNSDVWLIVHEKFGPYGERDTLLAIDLEKAKFHGQFWAKNSMFYWDRDLMSPLAAIEPCGGSVPPERHGIQGVLL